MYRQNLRFLRESTTYRTEIQLTFCAWGISMCQSSDLTFALHFGILYYFTFSDRATTLNLFASGESRIFHETRWNPFDR